MGKKKAAVSKSQLIREFLAEHPDAQNKDVAEALKKHKVNAQDVANLKARMKAQRKKPRKKAGRPLAVPTKPADSLDNAIKFVEQAGGLKNAKAALEKIERIKQL